MTGAVIVVTLLAGAAGALLRHAVGRALSARGPDGEAGALLLVNTVGCAVAGAFLVVADAELRYIALSGFAGGLTTFSTWTVVAVERAMSGRWRSALLEVAAHLALGLLAALGGAGLTLAALAVADGFPPV